MSYIIKIMATLYIIYIYLCVAIFCGYNYTNIVASYMALGSMRDKEMLAFRHWK